MDPPKVAACAGSRHRSRAFLRMPSRKRCESTATGPFTKHVRAHTFLVHWDCRASDTSNFSTRDNGLDASRAFSNSALQRVRRCPSVQYRGSNQRLIVSLFKQQPRGCAMNGIWLTKPRSHADRMRYYRSEAARCRDMGAATSFTHAKQ